jgi:hypothetical protein
VLPPSPRILSSPGNPVHRNASSQVAPTITNSMLNGSLSFMPRLDHARRFSSGKYLIGARHHINDPSTCTIARMGFSTISVDSNSSTVLRLILVTTLRHVGWKWHVTLTARLTQAFRRGNVRACVCQPVSSIHHKNLNRVETIVVRRAASKLTADWCSNEHNEQNNISPNASI